MNTTKTSGRSFRLNLVAAALLAAFGHAALADDEMAQYIDPDSSISFGIGQWGRDRPQQGIYDGQAEGRAYGVIDADVKKLDRETGTWLGLQAKGLGLDPRVRLEYLQQGVQGITLQYEEISRDEPLRIFSDTQGLGTILQTLNAGAGTSTNEIGLHLRRSITELGLYRSISDGLDVQVSFKNEDKNGDRHWSRGGTGEFLAEPIDSNTRQLDATVNFTRDDLQLSGGYSGSWYRTANTLVDSIRAGAAPATLANHNYMSLPLNNQAHQLFLNGGYRITPTTRATFKLAYTRATQDEPIPTADIVGLAAATAPRNLDGRVDTTLMQVGLTARPLQDLSVNAMLRRHELDDKTPAREVVTPNASNVQPYSFTTDTAMLEGTYRLPYRLSLTGGVDLKRQDRPIVLVNASPTLQRKVPHRAEIDEETYRLQLRRAMSETLNGALAYSYSDRSGSAFTLTDAVIQDRINPLHISDRIREKVRVSLDWILVEGLSLQAAADYSQDDYGFTAARPYGIREGHGSSYSVDLAYALGDDWKLKGWIAHDESKALQVNDRDQDSATPNYNSGVKTARLADLSDSLGLGVEGMVTSKLRVGGEAQYAVFKNRFAETVVLNVAGGTLFPAGYTAPLPSTESTSVKVSLFSEYALDKHSDLRVDFIHERWRSNDWQWEFGNGTAYIYGTTTDGTVVVAAPKQISNFVGARYTYKFQ